MSGYAGGFDDSVNSVGKGDDLDCNVNSARNGLFGYSFTVEQAKVLALMLRHRSEFDGDTGELNDLYTKLQVFLFNKMTIDEAEKFFL